MVVAKLLGDDTRLTELRAIVHFPGIDPKFLREPTPAQQTLGARRHEGLEIKEAA